MKTLTVRWLLKDKAMKVPWQREGETLKILFCKECYKSPPERSEFLFLGDEPYCHECIAEHMKKGKAPNMEAAEAEHPDEQR